MITECLGVLYSAEPIFEESTPGDLVSLELHVVSFESSYYTTNQGGSHRVCYHTADLFSDRQKEAETGRKRASTTCEDLG